MGSLVALLPDCMDSLKSILTSQDFGSEYEILCTELSVQWLRIRLWGQSVSRSHRHLALKSTHASQVGLHMDGAHQLQNSMFNRPEVETTVTQAVNSIAYLLTEIEVLRRRYELRPRLIPENPEDEKTQRDSKPHSGLSRPAKYLQERIRDNQKQKSFLAIAKWAIYDAKRFDEKVRRLKNLIDGLEDISKAAGIVQFQPSPQDLTIQAPIAVNEDPPPYSVEPPSQQAQPIEVVTAAIESSSTQDRQLLEQYTYLKQYLASLPTNASPRSRALHALLTLQDKQFKELQVDVCDELFRRRGVGAHRYSPPVEAYNLRRIKAREKLLGLSWYRFGHLVTDVVFEIERRFPSLIDETQRIGQPVVTARPLARTATTRNRRHGYVPPRELPPPLLRHRASHPATLYRANSDAAWPLPMPSARHSQRPTTSTHAVRHYI
jgi:hypothetical protein